jgi:hypothetical protein
MSNAKKQMSGSFGTMLQSMEPEDYIQFQASSYILGTLILVIALFTVIYAFKPKGPQGPDGVEGPAGAQGLPGARGLTTFVYGASGAKGVIGPTGALGPQGQQGIQGPATNWSSFTLTSTGPGESASGVLTNVGPATWTMGLTLPTAWPFEIGTTTVNVLENEPTGPYVSIVGPTGATQAYNFDFGILMGPTGPTGAKGPAGINGTTGAQGATGPTGLNGRSSEQVTGAWVGATGPTGATGPYAYSLYRYSNRTWTTGPRLLPFPAPWVIIPYTYTMADPYLSFTASTIMSKSVPESLESIVTGPTTNGVSRWIAPITGYYKITGSIVAVGNQGPFARTEDIDFANTGVFRLVEIIPGTPEIINVLPISCFVFPGQGFLAAYSNNSSFSYIYNLTAGNAYAIQGFQPSNSFVTATGALSFTVGTAQVTFEFMGLPT